jgi:carbamoyltransferase
MSNRYILGIWDGHDAGAALLKGDQILFAINEERLTRRKLDVGFPRLSIEACLAHARITPADVKQIALSTTDPAKTLTRMVPGLKEEYYLIRRRKKRPGTLDPLKKGFKYLFTEVKPNPLSRYLTRTHIRKALHAEGFHDFHLFLLDHHRCHAEAAARFSGLERCLVLTLDGVGDGFSGSIWQFQNDHLKHIKSLPARVSLGIFFEHVTHLMNMRELEDEGKVMALANYAYPIEDRDNPLMNLIQVRGLELTSPYSTMALYRKMKNILWQFPSEQFAFMAQRTLENKALTLIENALSQTEERNVALSGGVFSNIKLNMRIESLKSTNHVFTFPHMGDGGLAIGAAAFANTECTGVARYPATTPSLGPAFSEETICRALDQKGFPYEHLENTPETAAELVLQGHIILWFRGRMEMGPRALGNRSILARPDQQDIKDRLNLVLKKRVWYQPFCPSILEEDAHALLHLENRHIEDNPFMTSGFRVRTEYRPLMAGVINVDGTCRPHFVCEENPDYKRLLLNLKKELGRGVILNTSFNIHGEPIVCTPEDALDMFERTEVGYLFLEDFLVVKG